MKPILLSSRSERDQCSAPECTMEYLADLVKEKKQLEIFANIFPNIERLVEEEIIRVRMALFQCHFSFESFKLPQPEGEPIIVQEKVYIPQKEHPAYNFVGRLLGPRGMTVKQLEHETGCKIMVRGRGSVRDCRKEAIKRGKPNWEHLNDDLHVLVQCEDTPNRAYVKLSAAVGEIRKLFIPVPLGTDELKRKQLTELAILNGTYRSFTKLPSQAPRLLAPMTLTSPIRTASALPTQPIFVSPATSPVVPGSRSSMDSALASLSAAGSFQPCSNYISSSSLEDNTEAPPAALEPFFISSTAITPPNSAGSEQR